MGVVTHSLAEMKLIASQRGGKCLSKKYVGFKRKLKWACNEKHLWETTPELVFRGHWCIYCKKWRSENVCRMYFEYIFGVKFNSAKPVWLKNPSTGGRLELDGYNDELGIAFEYQGLQHFQDTGKFNINLSLSKRILYDNLKLQLCEKNNVKLIVIPFTINYDKMADYIYTQCTLLGIKLEKEIASIKIDLFGAYTHQELNIMKAYARGKGGKCLSTSYINSKTKLKWQCSKGHIWDTIPNIIQQGKWCPTCGGRKKLTLSEIQNLATKKGGSCLSKAYVNANTKMRWKCKNDHIWDTPPINIIHGSWCPRCAIKKYTIVEINKLVESKGGLCISQQYTDSLTKLEWQCKEGHKWKALLYNIKNGGWCPICAGVKRYKIEDMHKLALSKGGQCLSDAYKGVFTKLNWQCKENHTWYAAPNHIIEGTWCPFCSYKRRRTNLREN